MNTTLLQKLRVLASLVVGLGGSGQRVLDALKALIIERLQVSDFPLVDLLAMDVVREHQALTPGEFLQLRIRGLDHAMERFPWAKDLKRYPLVRRLTSVEKGCGGIPAVGRLAFAVNRSNILSTLRHKIRSVSDRAAYQRADQIGADPQQQMELPVWLIVSFFGSTGSGMFFDVAAHIKQIDVPTRTYAVIFLPDCYSHISEEDFQRGKATGYGMLRQLNHLLKGGEFVADDDGGKAFRGTGLIEQVYIVNGLSERGIVLDGEREDPFRMAAEFLYDYLFTDFGRQLEAQILNNRLAHPGVAAFGIHKIVHPARQLGQLEKLDRALNGLQRVQLPAPASENGSGKPENKVQENIKEVEQ